MVKCVNCRANFPAMPIARTSEQQPVEYWKVVNVDQRQVFQFCCAACMLEYLFTKAQGEGWLQHVGQYQVRVTIEKLSEIPVSEHGGKGE